VFRYFLLLNTLIPISLIVTIEMVKLIQAFFITNDAQMFCQERDKPAKVSSASLNEELGQVDYIFSDKTGTLTRNIMQFKLCYVGFELYGDSSLLKANVNPYEVNPPILRSNTKQGVQYVFKNKQLDDIVFNADVEDSVQHQYEIHSKTRALTVRFDT